MTSVISKIRSALAAMAWALIILAGPGPALAGTAGSPLDARAIVEKANHVALYQGDSLKGQVRITITDRQGRIRKRTMNIFRQNAGGLAQNYMTYFKAPADVRKMVFMVNKHSAIDRDDDRWLYLPGLDLVKRIAASDKRTSFVGSDFLYEDISGRHIEADTHTLVRTTDRFHVIDNRPKNPSAVEFAHYLAFVDKTNFVTMKLEFYKPGEALYRTITVLETAPIKAMENSGSVTFPTVIRSEAVNLETGSRTEMAFSRVVYNLDLGKEVFSERYLRRPPREICR